jgi:hypothetical protein
MKMFANTSQMKKSVLKCREGSCYILGNHRPLWGTLGCVLSKVNGTCNALTHAHYKLFCVFVLCSPNISTNSIMVKSFLDTAQKLSGP